MRHTDLKAPLTEGQRRCFVHFSLRRLLLDHCVSALGPDIQADQSGIEGEAYPRGNEKRLPYLLCRWLLSASSHGLSRPRLLHS